MFLAGSPFAISRQHLPLHLLIPYLMAWTCSQAWQLTPWHYWKKNVEQGYSWWEKDRVVAWYNGRERLWTVDLISDRSRWRQDSKWECMSETCWKQQKTKEEEGGYVNWQCLSCLSLWTDDARSLLAIFVKFCWFMEYCGTKYPLNFGIHLIEIGGHFGFPLQCIHYEAAR